MEIRIPHCILGVLQEGAKWLRPEQRPAQNQFKFRMRNNQSYFLPDRNRGVLEKEHPLGRRRRRMKPKEDAIFSTSESTVVYFGNRSMRETKYILIVVFRTS